MPSVVVDTRKPPATLRKNTTYTVKPTLKFIVPATLIALAHTATLKSLSAAKANARSRRVHNRDHSGTSAEVGDSDQHAGGRPDQHNNRGTWRYGDIHLPGREGQDDRVIGDSDREDRPADNAGRDSLRVWCAWTNLHRSSIMDLRSRHPYSTS